MYTLILLIIMKNTSSVQSFSRVWLFATPWTTACQASLSITNSRELAQTHFHQVGGAIQPSHPLLLLPSIFPSIRVFSNESALRIKWPNFGVSDSTLVLLINTLDWSSLGWTGWISVQGTLKSLLQHHSSKGIIFGFSFLYSPTLTSIHDYWQNHSFD